MFNWYETSFSDFVYDFSYFLEDHPLIILFISFIISHLFISAVYWSIFAKAGERPWKSTIPFYNTWVLFNISGIAPAYSLALYTPLILGIIPFFGLILWIWAFYIIIVQNVKLAKSFGKSEEFTGLMIILPIIAYPILAWGESQYSGRPFYYKKSGSRITYKQPKGHRGFNNFNNSNNYNNFNQNVSYGDTADLREINRANPNNGNTNLNNRPYNNF